MKNVPKEYQEICPLCGAIIDARDLNQVLGHVLNLNTGKCEDTNPQIHYSSSRKVGDPGEWPKGKTGLNLN